jgi:hypothetical protein
MGAQIIIEIFILDVFRRIGRKIENLDLVLVVTRRCMKSI